MTHRQVGDLRIGILGGGPAGLFVGYFARKADLPFDIYEASDQVGGNTRTFRIGEFRFDTGAHRFHDKDPGMTAEMLELMGDRIRELSVPSYIYHRGRLLPFPLTPRALLTRLPVGTLLQSGLHILTAPRPGTALNFRDYAYRRYGQPIADLFLTNYSAKLWGVHPQDLSTSVAGDRLKGLSIASLIAEVLNPRRKTTHMEGTFYYPRHGFGQIAETVAAFCGREAVHLNSPVTRIRHDRSHILGFEIKGQEFVHASHIASSLGPACSPRSWTRRRPPKSPSSQPRYASAI